MNIPRRPEFFKHIFLVLVLISALFDLTNGGTSTTTSNPITKTTKPTKQLPKEPTKPPTSKKRLNTTISISSRSSDSVQHEGSAERLKRQLYREQIPHYRPLSGNIYSDHHGFPHPGRWYPNAQQIVRPNSSSGHHFESPNVILNDDDFRKYGSTLQHIDEDRIRKNPQPIHHEYPVQVSEVVNFGGPDTGHGYGVVEQPYVPVHDHTVPEQPYTQGHSVSEQPYVQYGPAPVPVSYGHGHTVTHYHHHIPVQNSNHYSKGNKPFLRLKFPFFGGGHKGHRHHQRPNRFNPPFMKNHWSPSSPGPGRYNGAGSKQYHHETAHRGAYSWEVGY